MVIYQNEGKGTKLLRDSDTQLYHFQLKNLLSSELQSSSFGEQHVLFFRLLGPKRFKDNCSRVPEKAMAPHSTTLAWKIPWMEEPGRLQSMGSLRVGHGWELPFHFSLSCVGEGNGNPLQSSCLENPRDGRAWWAAVYGVAQSRTRLK